MIGYIFSVPKANRYEHDKLYYNLYYKKKNYGCASSVFKLYKLRHENFVKNINDDRYILKIINDDNYLVKNINNNT